ncbi:MAG: hypothetical protein ACRD1U_10540, partial [Vicinamibacterales bacterium]
AERREDEEAAAAARRAAGQKRRSLRRAAPKPPVDDGPAAAEPLVVPDQFAEFREEYDHVVPEIFRHMPLTGWARTEKWQHEEASEAQGERELDEVRELMSGLRLPAHVAGVAYARGCRIRRVRVPGGNAPAARGEQTVILSRRVLEEVRGARA